MQGCVLSTFFVSIAHASMVHDARAFIAGYDSCQNYVYCIYMHALLTVHQLVQIPPTSIAPALIEPFYLSTAIFC